MRVILRAVALALMLAAPAMAQSNSEGWKDDHNDQISSWTGSIAKGKYRGLALAEAYWNRGRNYASLGKHELAIADYDRAIKLYGTPLTEAHYDRATSLRALGRGKEADKELEILTARQRALNAKMVARMGPNACREHPAFKSAITLVLKAEAALKRRDMLAANRLADAAWWSSNALIQGFNLVRRAELLDDSEGAYEQTVETLERKGQLEKAAREKLNNLASRLWIYGDSSCAGTPAPVRIEIEGPPPPVQVGKGK